MNFTNGQTYYPLVDTNKVWNELIEWADGITFTNYITKFTSDTVINSFHYKKVLITYDSAQINWTNNGYIREDSTKKVFLKEEPDSADKLLYDFNIGLNDTVTLPYIPAYFGSLKVEAIDSVNIYGHERKRFHLSWVQDTMVVDIWVEGIGSMRGVLTTLNLGIPNSQDDVLLCFTENDTLKYINPVYNTCYYSGVGIHGYNTNLFATEIFPNPATSNITIEISQNSAIEILNIEGQLIKAIAARDNKISIDVSALPCGVYFVKIKTEKGVAVKKFVKE